MDLIFQTRVKGGGFEDTRIANPIRVDAEIGDANDFSIILAASELEELTKLGAIEAWYIDGTEWGGIVDKLTTDTAADRVELYGRTWAGVLASHLIRPYSIADEFFSVSGTLREVLTDVIDHLGLSAVFGVGTVPDHNLTYIFTAYQDGYTAIVAFLEHLDLKAKIRCNGEKVYIDAEPTREVTEFSAADGSSVDFTASRFITRTNQYIYLICEGDEILKDNRVIVMRLNCSTGDISRVSSYTPNAFTRETKMATLDDTVEKLEQSGRARLREVSKQLETITGAALNTLDVYDVGDFIVAEDERFGITVNAAITKKIMYWLDNGDITINYKIGV